MLVKREDFMPPKKQRKPPARTAAAREKQMMALAIYLAEQKLADGTASSQIVLHYLKLASTKEDLEKEKLKSENELLKAKATALRSAKDTEELYKDALNAMRQYSGQSERDDSDE